MSYETITTTRAGNVLKLNLNRPERLNACPPQMADEIFDALRDLDGARAVLMTGEGRAFCSGADLAANADKSGTGPINGGDRAFPSRPRPAQQARRMPPVKKRKRPKLTVSEEGDGGALGASAAAPAAKPTTAGADGTRPKAGKKSKKKKLKAAGTAGAAESAPAPAGAEAAAGTVATKKKKVVQIKLMQMQTVWTEVMERKRVLWRKECHSRVVAPLIT